MSFSVPKYTFSRDTVALWDALGKCHCVHLTDEETKAKDLPKVTWWVHGGPRRSDPSILPVPCLLVPSQAKEALLVIGPPSHPPVPAALWG